METFIIIIVIVLAVIAISCISANKTNTTIKTEAAETSSNTDKKKELKDFFNVDINNIYKYKFTYDGVALMPKDCLDIYGITHKNKFKHILSTLEFGYFSEVEIVSNSREIEKDIYSIDIEPEESPTITFYGNTHAQINSQIHDFVNWCFAQYGYDDIKQGGITYENMVQEFSYVERGIFSRMWKKVWLHIEDGKFVLVLFDVPQENKPIV